MIKIAPSILSADFARLGEQVAAAEVALEPGGVTGAMRGIQASLQTVVEE